MQRFLTGSILLSWITLMMAAGTASVFHAETDSGLLRVLLAAVTDPHAIGLAPGIARVCITALTSITLAVMLWALMFAFTSDREDVRERRLALAIAFGWMLAMIALAGLLTMIAGSTSVLPDLFALQMATLLSMIAVGGVEYAREARLLELAPENGNAPMAQRLTSHMAVTSAKLATAARPAENKKAT